MDAATSGAQAFEAALVGYGDQVSCQLWSVRIHLHVLNPAVAEAYRRTQVK